MVKKIQKKKSLVLREKLKMVAWFLIKFNLLAIPLYLILYFGFYYSPLQSFLTTISRPVIGLFGYETTLVDQDFCNVQAISGPMFEKPICISWDSTGWKSMYALAALAIATPFIAWKKKLKFLYIGIPLVFALNYLRIVSTIIISLKFGFQYFDIVHTVLWREGLILVIVAIWYIWLRRIKYNIQLK